MKRGALKNNEFGHYKYDSIVNDDAAANLTDHAAAKVTDLTILEQKEGEKGID